MAYLRRVVVGGALLTAATLCTFLAAGVGSAGTIAGALPGGGENIAPFGSWRISALGRLAGERRLGLVLEKEASMEVEAMEEEFGGSSMEIGLNGISQDGDSDGEAAYASGSDSSMRTFPAGNLNRDAARAREAEAFDERGRLKRGPQRPVRSTGKRNLLPKRWRPGQGPVAQEGAQELSLAPVKEPQHLGVGLRITIAQVGALCAALNRWYLLLAGALLVVLAGAIAFLAHRGLLRRRRRPEARVALLEAAAAVPSAEGCRRKPPEATGDEAGGGDLEFGSIAASSSS